jgi:glycosyltransferase involved in cell wall biosynthesis
MVNGLKKRGHSVTEIGPLSVPMGKVLKLAHRIYQRLTGKHYDFNRSRFVAKSFARQVLQRLSNNNFDLILCPSSIPCAYLETDIPIITWEDATFAGMVGYYPGAWQRLSKLAITHGNSLQSRALKNAKLALFCSDWAARSALDNYDVNPSKVKVIPFGANLSELPSLSEVETAIENRSKESCHLLFIGVDWFRKGGDLVIQTALALREKGISVFVDIVGCDPVGDVPDFVRQHGFISKSTQEGKNHIRELLLASHYLFVPSTAECYGMVFAEASAHGVPSLARATGGVPTVVKNGVNGYTFPMEAQCQVYADYIESELKNIKSYQDSAHRARQQFDQCLNWESAIIELESAVKDFVVVTA